MANSDGKQTHSSEYEDDSDSDDPDDTLSRVSCNATFISVVT